MVGCLSYVLSGVVDARVGVCVCGWADGVVDALAGVRMGRKRWKRAWLGVCVKEVLLIPREIERMMGWPLGWLVA